MAMDELKYVDGKFTVNGIDVNSISATTEALEIAQTVSANTSQFSVEEDLEDRLELIVDSSDKIVSYRKQDGTKVENIGVETSRLKLSEEGLSDFTKDLISSGFNPKNVVDWSDESFVQIPLPRTLARINLIIDRLPTTADANYDAVLEYWDMDGNYFKKPITKVCIQGNSSAGYSIKNIKFDIGDKSEWKFGHWVPQDSFHLKAFYIDVFVGVANMVYNYVESLYREIGLRPTRCAFDESGITKDNGTGKMKTDWDTGAMGHPEGFPFELYVNGKYYALYAFNMKKHRDNYLMDKKDYKTIHIDGYIHDATFFSGSNKMNWEKMELKNPKTMICMDGSTYDDDAPKELIDETSEFWDSSNKDMKNTLVTKNILKSFSDKWKEIQDMTDAAMKLTDPGEKAQAIEEAREYLKTFYDVDSAIMFYLISEVIWNADGIYGSNTQWLIYNGEIMTPSFYDLDSIFGRCGNGMAVYPSEGLIMHPEQLRAYKLLDTLFNKEVKEFYTKMRKNGLISTKYIMKFVNDYVEKVGYRAYKRNIDMRVEKKLEIPSYRDINLNSDYWEYISFGESYPLYSDETNYVVGDYCHMTYGQASLIAKCIKDCKGKSPFLPYTSAPRYFGMYDSPKRIEKWLDARLVNLDSFYLITD